MTLDVLLVVFVVTWEDAELGVEVVFGVLEVCLITDGVVIIEDTLSMFKEFISSQIVRKNYYPPDNNLETD